MFERYGPAVLFGVLLLMYFTRIAGYPLQDPDEGRYAQIAYEMVRSGDWVTPTLHGVVYFDKPPLLYWLVAAAFRGFGPSEAAARVIPAAAGLMTVAITFFLGRAMFGRAAAVSASVILATSPLFFFFSQVVTTDMVLTLFMTATMACVWLVHAGADRRRWAVCVALFAALGTLAKGPVAIALPGLIAVLFLISRGDRAAVRALLGGRPILVYGAIALPWFAAVSWINPEFPHYFFVRHNVERFATAAVGHPEGPFFYVPFLLAGALPWTIVVPALLWGERGKRWLDEPACRFLLIWAVVVLVFFSIARSKLPAYILPAFPALALWAGHHVSRCFVPQRVSGLVERAAGLFLIVGLVLAVVGLIGAFFVSSLAGVLDRDAVDVATVVHTAALAGIGTVAMAYLARSVWRHGERSPARSVALIGACIGVVVYLAIGARGIVKTSREVGNAIQSVRAPGDLVVSYKRLFHALPFYGGVRPVHAVSYGELTFGAALASDRDEFFWADREQVVQAWESGRRVFVVTSRRFEDELLEILQPVPRVLVRDADRVVLVNFDSTSSDPRPLIEAPRLLATDIG